MDLEPPNPLGNDLHENWMLEERVAFLNHGSFGAIPRATFRCQQRWAARVEAEPVEFLIRRYHDLIERTKSAVGQWLGMNNEDFGLVANATEGVNAVLASTRLEPGDELVTTNHVYNAIRQAMRRTAHRWGAAYREIVVQTPVADSDEIVERITAGLTDRTKLLVLDHVTSPTALVFPAERIVVHCASRGVDVLIDGAHAPGMVELDVTNTGAAWYTGNLHKWACCPRSVGFLWTRPDRQSHTHPAIVSHLYEKGYAAEFEWLGTRDPSPWLATPTALRLMSRVGWPRIQSHNRALALWASRMLCERWQVKPLTINPQMLGAMATLPLPGRLANLTEDRAKSLQRSLYHDHQIEVPLTLWQNHWHTRISCQIYNTPKHYERLAIAVERILRS
jgi:isopenicillin-N epimerase